MEEKIVFLNEDGRPDAEAVIQMMGEKQFSRLRELLSEFPAADIAELSTRQKAPSTLLTFPTPTTLREAIS